MLPHLLLGIVALGLAALAGTANADPVRVAILTPNDDYLGSMLTAELSKDPGVALVERAEIQRVAEEKGLADLSHSASLSKVGQLLNADALLIVTGDATTDTAPLSVRLVAVKPGVVFYSTVVPPSSIQTPEGISGLARQLAPFFSKVHLVNKEDILKISLLGLRLQFHPFELDAGWETSANRLLADRLSREPKMVVLERWNLDAAAFEKSLMPDDPSPFWTGSYLLDGRINVQDDHRFVAEVQIHGPGIPQPISIVTPPAANIADMVDALVKRISQALGTKPSSAPWDRIAEGQNYLHLARWSAQNEIYPEAFDAEESASALGIQGVEIDLLKIEIVTGLLSPARESPNFSKETWNGILVLAAHSLDRLGGYWKDPSSRDASLSEDQLTQLTSKLVTASALWVNGSRPGSVPVPPDLDSNVVNQVRQSLRQMAAILSAQSISVPAQTILLPPIVFDRIYPNSVYSWFDSPEEAASFYQKLFSFKPDPNHPWAFLLLRRPWMQSNRQTWADGFVSPADALINKASVEFTAQWDILEDRLTHSSLPQEQADGWFLRLNRDSIEFGPAKGPEGGLMAQTLPGSIAFIWDHRNEAVGPEPAIDFVALGETLANKLQLRTQLNPGEPPGDIAPYAPVLKDTSFRAFPQKFLAFLLQSGTCVDPEEIRAFCEAAAIADRQKLMTLAPQFKTYRAAIKNTPGDTHATETILDVIENWYFYDLDPAPEKEAIEISKETDPGLAGFPVRTADGTSLTFICQPDAIELRDPNAGTRESIRLWVPDHRDGYSLAQRLSPGLIAVSPGFIFLAADDFRSYNRTTQHWSWFRSPFPFRATKILSQKGSSKVLMLLGDAPTGGGIINFDPATNTYETILSSHERPPKSNLDGRPGDRPLDFATAADGSIFYAVKMPDSNLPQDEAKSPALASVNEASHDLLFHQDPATGTWNKLFSLESTPQDRNLLSLFSAADGLLVLTRYPLGPSYMSAFGQLLEFSHDAAVPEVLLTNPYAPKPPVAKPSRWEMPPDLAGSSTSPQVELTVVKDGEDLWILRWQRGSKKIIHGMVYLFEPGSRQPHRLALNLEPPQGEYPYDQSISFTSQGITLNNQGAASETRFISLADLRAKMTDSPAVGDSSQTSPSQPIGK